MVINGTALFKRAPVDPIVSGKVAGHGVTYGLGEAGYDVRIAQDIVLHPLRRFTLASTVERFQMPDDVIGIVHDKSTWARRGLSVFNTVIESGWKGWLTLELVYHGWRVLRIPAGAGIAQVVFHQIAEPRVYTGRYNNQPNRPVSAILEKG